MLGSRAYLPTILGVLALWCGVCLAPTVRADEESATKPAETKPAIDDDQPTAHKTGEKHPEGEKHGSGENEFDLSHANAGPQQGSIVEIKQDQAIYTFIVFLLLMAVVTKFAWRPIMEGLAKRENSIAHMIDEAKDNAHKAQESLRQYEAKLAAATEETRQMLALARQDAEAAKEKIVAEAQAAAQRERDKSLAEIRAAKESALREMAQKSVDSAFALAGRIIHKELRPADHAELISESLSKFSGPN